jgi:hypothetical protein
MASHLFNPDGLLGTGHHARVAFRAITGSGYSYTFGIKVKHVFRAYFETFTMVLALIGVYFRKVHAQS